MGFNPGVSNKAKKKLMDKIRKLEIGRKVGTELANLAKIINPILRGWINHFDKYNKTAINPILTQMDDILVSWAVNKYKSFKGSRRKANHWISKIAKREPNLFAHWQIKVATGQ